MRRLGYALSAVALCSLAFGPGYAMAADNVAKATEKDETVRKMLNDASEQSATADNAYPKRLIR